MGTTSTENSVRYTGKVKWFNVKNGYGFITPVNNEANVGLDRDIFVHHSSIIVNRDQYKYLTVGEYVDFNLDQSENSEHKYHAVNVTGVARGTLLCETRFEGLEGRRERVPRASKESQTQDNFEYPKQKKISRQSSRVS